MTNSAVAFSDDDDLRIQFMIAADAAGADGEHLLRDYMLAYMSQHEVDEDAYNNWVLKQTQIGIDQISAGDVISNEEVEAERIAWRETMRQKIADAAS